MLIIEDVLKRPVVTEKTVAQKGKFTFVVHSDATKKDVELAVKEFYGVDVENVNMINLPAKTRLMGKGKVARKRAPLRKAIVTVKDGKTIDFNAFK